MSDQQPWFKAAEGAVNRRVLDYVSAVERDQMATFERFARLVSLYDPNSPDSNDIRQGASVGVVTENVIATNVDTVAAVVSTTDVRARFMTDDADWSTQRRARRMEWYAEEQTKVLDVMAKCRDEFKLGAALKGTAIIKVTTDRWDRIRVESVQVDDIIVDDRECVNGRTPRQMHQRMVVSRDELAAQFPDDAVAIETAHRSAARKWAGYRSIDLEEVVVVESWKLPFGVQGEKGYKPGRHTICVDNADLFDEKYHDDGFPFAVMRWSRRSNSWYGISLAERIAGHQRALNRRNLHIERSLDLVAFPTTYVRLVDANLQIKTINRIGTVAVIKGEPPITITPPAVSGEIYKSRDDLKISAGEEAGVSGMAARGTKPGGLDSGAALREYRDATTQRFALQEKAFETFVLDVIWLVIKCCKELGDNAPSVTRHTANVTQQRIDWDDVDMGEVKVQIAAASTLSRTPAGRMQTVLEWAQAGIISQDEARRLMRHPDLERTMSVYTAAMEAIEERFEEIADGAIVMPEPFDNLKMAAWRGQMQYLDWRNRKAPDDILEALRQFVEQAAFLSSQATMPAANDNAAAPAMGAEMGPGMLPGGPPANEQAVAALAPQAMDLMAG